MAKEGPRASRRPEIGRPSFALETSSLEITYICDAGDCGKIFTTQGLLTRHKKEIHGGLTFLCDKETELGKHCTKSFGTKRGLESHVRLVHNIIICKEPNCAKTCTRGNYEQHLDECHRSFPCLIGKCKRRLNNADALRQHRQKAHGYLISRGVPPEHFIEQPKPPKQPKPSAPPPPELLAPECIDEESNTWMIPSRVNKHIQLEYVIFARGAYLDESDGHMKLGGEQVSPIIWADTLMALTRGQETSFSRLADNKYFINSTADEGKECEDCGCLISWRSSLLRFNGKTGPLTFPGTKYCNVCYIRRRRDKGETIAKESYGVEGPVSKLWTLPAIQPLIDEQLQDMYCRGHDCGIKLSKENAIYDRSSSMDHYPFIVRSLCKDCNRKAKKGSFMGAVDRWARRRMKKDRPCVFASLDQARMAFVVTYIQGYCVGAPQLSVALFQELVQVASHLRQLCFWCGSQLRYERGTDPRVRKSIDRTTFVSGVSLPYGHPDQIMVLSCASCNSIFSDRDILERIEYLDQLAKEMPAGVVWGDMVLDKIENFDEELERNRPDVDPYLRKSYDTFLRHRINKGKEHRIQHWTFEKYRFYLEVCERQSVVSGMKPRKCCDFDRCINTDPYDLHTVVYMEREINFMKQDFLEFQNDDEFKRSKEKSRTRWAVNVLRKHLFKLIDDTNELKLGWESRIEKMKKNPLPCLHFHQTPLLTRAEDTSIVESSSSPPAQVQTQPSTQAVTPTQGPIVHARYSLQNKRVPFQEIGVNGQGAALATNGQPYKMDSCSSAKRQYAGSSITHPVAAKKFRGH